MTRLKYILLMSALVASMTTTAQISFTGNDREIMEITPEANTGLSKIYVLNGADGVGMSYTATTMNPVTWFTYGEQGGAVMQEIYDVIDDRDNPYLSSIAQVKLRHGHHSCRG